MLVIIAFTIGGRILLQAARKLMAAISPSFYFHSMYPFYTNLHHPVKREKKKNGTVKSFKSEKKNAQIQLHVMNKSIKLYMFLRRINSSSTGNRNIGQDILYAGPRLILLVLRPLNHRANGYHEYGGVQYKSCNMQFVIIFKLLYYFRFI